MDKHFGALGGIPEDIPHLGMMGSKVINYHGDVLR
jgi:hypothetical protein